MWRNFRGVCCANSEDEPVNNIYSEAQLAYCFQTYCGSFSPEMWVRTGVVIAAASRAINGGGVEGSSARIAFLAEPKL